MDSYLFLTITFFGAGLSAVLPVKGAETWRQAVQRIERKIQKQQATIDNQQNIIESQHRKIDSQDARIGALSKSLYNATNVVAFSAHASTDRSYESGATILFDSPLLNIGSDYDPATSIFTCPVKGIYGFSSSLMAREEQVSTALVVNSMDFLHLYTYEDHAQASNFVMVECPAGATAHVEMRSPHTVAGGPTAVFSGFLLQVLV